jgi:hypothetical protein
MRGHEALEPAHEQGQHFVHVDDDERRGGIDVRLGEIARGRGWFQWRISGG